MPNPIDLSRTLAEVLGPINAALEQFCADETFAGFSFSAKSRSIEAAVAGLIPEGYTLFATKSVKSGVYIRDAGKPEFSSPYVKDCPIFRAAVGVRVAFDPVREVRMYFPELGSRAAQGNKSLLLTPRPDWTVEMLIACMETTILSATNAHREKQVLRLEEKAAAARKDLDARRARNQRIITEILKDEILGVRA